MWWVLCVEWCGRDRRAHSRSAVVSTFDARHSRPEVGTGFNPSPLALCRPLTLWSMQMSAKKRLRTDAGTTRCQPRVPQLPRQCRAPPYAVARVGRQMLAAYAAKLGAQTADALSSAWLGRSTTALLRRALEVLATLTLPLDPRAAEEVSTLRAKLLTINDAGLVMAVETAKYSALWVAGVCAVSDPHLPRRRRGGEVGDGADPIRLLASGTEYGFEHYDLLASVPLAADTGCGY